LSPRVTAKEIMQILTINPKWRISGSSLQIALGDLERAYGPTGWMKGLIKEIIALKKEKKTNKQQ
jgi:hypothetical protein